MKSESQSHTRPEKKDGCHVSKFQFTADEVSFLIVGSVASCLSEQINKGRRRGKQQRGYWIFLILDVIQERVQIRLTSSTNTLSSSVSLQHLQHNPYT